MAGGAQIQLTINPAFLSSLLRVQTEFGIVSKAAMNNVMQEMARLAKTEADWNPDGTVVETPWLFKYKVTGTAREALVGFAVGANASPFAGFSVAGERWGPSGNPIAPEMHTSMDTPIPPEIPTLIQGLITMAEDHAAYLQAWESGNTSQSVNPSAAPRGIPVTEYILMDHEADVIAGLEAEIMALLRTLI